MEKQRTYYCIDMKTFYASVECAERGYNPFETNLVVADLSRGKNALCLAITPKMKAQGIKNRCRLSDIPGNVRYEVAPPRMALYIEYAADIYSLYLDYFDRQDIHVYSIDEAFIDVTPYLPYRGMDKFGLARFLMNEIADRYRIPSTAGIGTNLYLAKIALDITAKHARDHVGYLDEDLYRETLWDHRPITDFWMVAAGTARRLERYGVYDMRGVTQMDTALVYKVFGKDAELLVDHAWGRESCRISDIKNYRSKTKSVSFSQILPRDYSFGEARTVMREMALNGAAELMKRKVITGKVAIFVGYTHDERPPTKGGARLDATTNLASFLVEAAMALYDKTTDPSTPIRRLGIAFENVCDEGCEGYNLFTDFAAVDKERTLQHAVIGINEKFGKNAVLNGINYMPEGTQRERNGFIGGHRAGYDDKRRKS
ncbi:MAG: DNA repair protein [Clostridia bacterium]|nr:DNA repair protein [Clostridia bacterium]